MAGRRSARALALASPLAILAEAEALHRAITGAMAGLAVGGAHYGALERADAALHRLAAELGHPGRLQAHPPAVVRG